MKLKTLLNKSWLPLVKGAGRALALTEELFLKSPFWLKGAVMTLAMTGGSLVAASLATTPASAASISLSITSDTPSCARTDPQPGDICMDAPVGGGMAVGRHKVTVSGDAIVDGYTLTLHGSDDSTPTCVPGHADPNGDFRCINGATGTLDNPAPLDVNTWGVAIPNSVNPKFSSNDDYLNKSSSAKHMAIPLVSSPAPIVDLDSATVGSSDNTIDVIYGFNFPSDSKPGNYEEHVTYTATAKLPPEAPTDLGGKICQSGNSDNDCQVDIDENMIPVKYTGDATNPQWTVVANLEDAGNKGEWYDYSESKKRWANAVTLSNAKTYTFGGRCKSIVKTSDGSGEWSSLQLWTMSNSDLMKLVTGSYDGCDGVDMDEGISSFKASGSIDPADILGYWVYIPRYDYQVRTLSGSVATPTAQDFTIRFRKTGDSDTKWQTLTPTEAVGNSNDINNKAWATHPAFSWCSTNDDGSKKDCTELNGIWVGKFETTGSIAAPTILPNQYHKASEDIGVFYDIAKSIGVKDDNNPYGNGTQDVTQNSHNLSVAKTHMLKNSEWGAVAYLSSSKFGAGVNNVQLNSSSDLGSASDGDQKSSGSLTGCGPKADGDTTTYNCSGDTTHQYQSTIGQLASTTGNTYGVYDMAGGAWEYVMGNYNSNTSQSSTSYMNTAAKPPYVNVYTITSNSNCTWLTCGGDALCETASWGGDSASFVSLRLPWFYRGGYWDLGSSAGLFSSSYYNGSGSSYFGFRVSLLALPAE